MSRDICPVEVEAGDELPDVQAGKGVDELIIHLCRTKRGQLKILDIPRKYARKSNATCSGDLRLTISSNRKDRECWRVPSPR